MPQEIEIKIKLESHDVVRETLRAAGASLVGTVREINIFFDDERQSLRAKDSGLRVRLTTSSADPKPKALLTLKGPKGNDALRSREAFDVACDPSDQVLPLIHALGFQQKMLFEKDRESWELDACKIELDTLPHFGTYLEIEGSSEEAVRSVQKKLNLMTHEAERKSYSQLIGKHLKATGLIALTFSNP